MNRFLLPMLFCLGLFAGPTQAATDGAAVAGEIIRRGDAAITAYTPAAHLTTASELSSLYFDVFEGAGMELDLGIKAPSLKSELEVLFGSLNGKAMRGVPAGELAAAWQPLRSKLGEAAALYATPDSDDFLPTLLKSTLILLREGAEALLVVGALAAYLRRAGAADRIWVIHAGVGLAIPLSILTGWALNGVLQAAGASRGTIEGMALLLAALVLFYVSAWLVSKREAQRWQAWVAGQLDSALSRGSSLAIGAAACLAVYREGAETVLFYHALFAGNGSSGGGILAGIGLAAALLVMIYLLLNHLALRLPFARFFALTGSLLYGMGLVFLGQAIIALQATGHLASTLLPGLPQVGWLGFAPTAQGITAQGLMLLLPLLTWAWLQIRRPGRSA